MSGSTPRSDRFVLALGEPGFPERLSQAAGRTTTIWGRGNASSLTPGVAVIGARKATPYGIRASELVAEWAADRGVTVYSGAAHGCDQAAHEAALRVGGTTVAVLGCGADRAYPSNAATMLDQMCERGAVISPFEWGTPPARYRFVVRNQVIAALAALVVVTEGRIPSGTFSTVRYALDIGTDVGAVPGSIFSGFADAPNRLIADGARVISCPNDLYTALDMLVLQSPDGDHSEGESSFVVPRGDQRLVEALRAQPMSVTMLAQSLGLSAGEVAASLERLTVEGLLTRFRDGTYMVLKGN